MVILPRARAGAHVLRPALVVLVALAASLTLTTPAEAARRSTSVSGWSTSQLTVDQGAVHRVRATIGGARRAGRVVVLQRHEAGTSGWRAVARARTSSRGVVSFRVPTASATDGRLRLAVPAVRGARAATSRARGFVVRATASAQTPDRPLSAEETEVVRLVNEARAVARRCGSRGDFPAVGAVRAESRLSSASRAHALDMGEQDYFSHTSKDGRSPWQRAEQAGYPTASGENIAAGYGTPAEVVRGWLESEGHCVNIMAANARDLGVGRAVVDGSRYRTYWVQMFGRG